MQLYLKELSCERDERQLFCELNAVFSEGEIIQIAGENGAGKTTLLRMICGLTQQFEGELVWKLSNDDNVPPTEANDYAFLSSLLYLGHKPGLNTSLTPMENLRWFFALNGAQSRAQAETLVTNEMINEALEKTGVLRYADVPCRYLSAGQQRRVSLAKIYCSQAPLWVLDEPFTAIDKQGVSTLEEQFVRHSKAGGLIILTSHQVLNLENVRILDLSSFARKVA